MKRAVSLPGVLVVALVILLGVLGVGANSGVSSQLADIEAVKQVMYTYAYQIDSGSVDGLMSVFADDAIAEYSFPGGTFVLNGKPEIKAFLGPYTGTGGAHNMINPLVNVNGTTATGTFYLWRVQPASVNCPTAGTVGWILGRYDNDFVNLSGRWVIKHLRFMTESQGTLDGCKFVP